jgi:hypothetical protein
MKISDEITKCSSFTRFNYLNKEQNLFVITSGSFFGLYSTPYTPNLDINSYQEVLVSLYINEWGKVRDKFNDFDKYRVKNHMLMIWKMPLAEAERAHNIFMGEENPVKGNTIGPCYKCGLVDNWNSLAKDNKYYCYQHCYY